jgi:phosphatidylglycerol---prolipoprotein diacylglyceryl transferase
MKKAYVYLATGLVAIGLLTFFVFVPAFGGDLRINPSIDLGSFEVRWYGLIMAAAILTSYMIARKNSWKFGISPNDVDDYSFWVTLIGFIGARLYHVIFNLDFYSHHLSEIYKVWHGGLSIYGAILAGLAYTYFHSGKKAYTFSHLFDLIALSLPLGQAIGRLGNFVNQEAFGLPTDLPWKMYISPQFRPPQYIGERFFHPTFLYEALFDVLVFLILYKLIGKTKSGVIGLAYLIIYSLGRFFIESIRLDSYYVYGFRIDQVVAFLIIVIAGFIALRKHAKLVS